MRVYRKFTTCYTCGATKAETTARYCRPCIAAQMVARRTAREPCFRCGRADPPCGFKPNGYCVDCGREYARQYQRKRRASDQIFRQKLNDAARTTMWRLRDQVLDAYGRKCACCGTTQREFLAIDHINGGGTKHHKTFPGGQKGFLRWLRAQGFPAAYRCLCHNCNMSRGFYGYCPHDTERAS